MVGLTLDKMSDRDIACIDEMLIWKQFLLSQIGMNRGENSFITQGSRGRLDMGNQLWSQITHRSG